MICVLFVCLGNICRSPMAEAVFMHKVRKAGLEDRIEADSAGTGDWHLGKPPHRGTQQILRANNIEWTHASRQIVAGDYHDFDYILVMDAMNLRDVQDIWPIQNNRVPEAKRPVLARLMDYAPGSGMADVPDPYYDGRYAEVYELIDAATDGLLAAIRQEHAL